jgi:hypothetical protein
VLFVSVDSHVTAGQVDQIQLQQDEPAGYDFYLLDALQAS